jgi:hypothetical protein
VSKAVEGATSATVFESCVEQVLAPALKSTQIIMMDNLSAHKGERVLENSSKREAASFYTCHLPLARVQPHRGSLRPDQKIVAQGAGTKLRSPC